MKFMLRLGNPFVVWLLRSPLHFLISRRVMLITVMGRRTGKMYTTPVEYGEKGDRLAVTSTRERTWWRNVRGGAAVTVRVRGQEFKGLALASTDEGEVVAALRVIYPAMTPERARQFAAGRVAVFIQPAT